MKATSTVFLLFFFFSSSAQHIERSLVSTAGGSSFAGGYYLSYSLGESMVTPSPSRTLYNPFVFIPTMMTIGFQQPQVAPVGERVNIYNWVSAYPNPTSGLVHLDVHGDQFEVHAVRILNTAGQEVSVAPFEMTHGSIELHLNQLPAGAYMIAVTDYYTHNTVTTRVVKVNQ